MKTQSSEGRRKSAFVMAAVLSLAVSQLSSYLVHSRLRLDEAYVVNSFIQFIHVRNTGGVFGSFQGNSILFALLSSSLLIGVSAYLLRATTVDLFDSVCIGLFMGGGASNVLDRLIYNAVIDFIDIQNIPYWHYIFNTADVMIHAGAWSLLIRHLFFRKVQRPAAS